VRQIERKGASLHCVEQPIDTSTSAGRAFVGMLAVFAEFETYLRRERQMEGIAKAKREGKYKGRPRMMVGAEVSRLAAEGKGPTLIAKELDIGVATVHRRLAELRGAPLPVHPVANDPSVAIAS